MGVAGLEIKAMADHYYWLKLSTTKDENSRTRNGGDFHIKKPKENAIISMELKLFT